ncbi:MAG TPA: hypothetical protein V6D25_28900 [Leptolyngbyaceae cyanobacterium]
MYSKRQKRSQVIFHNLLVTEQVSMKDERQAETREFVGNLKNGIWLFGLSSWVFGITDRSIASFADGYLSALDLTQLFTAATFFVAWLFLKPTSRV